MSAPPAGGRAEGPSRGCAMAHGDRTPRRSTRATAPLPTTAEAAHHLTHTRGSRRRRPLPCPHDAENRPDGRAGHDHPRRVEFKAEEQDGALIASPAVTTSTTAARPSCQVTTGISEGADRHAIEDRRHEGIPSNDRNGPLAPTSTKPGRKMPTVVTAAPIQPAST